MQIQQFHFLWKQRDHEDQVIQQKIQTNKSVKSILFAFVFCAVLIWNLSILFSFKKY